MNTKRFRKTNLVQPVLWPPIPLIVGSRMRLIYEEAETEHPRWHLNQMLDGNWTFVLPEDTYPELFEIQCSEIFHLAPKHDWKSNPAKRTKSLWFPKDRIGDTEQETIKSWASQFEQFVLLGLNKNIKDYFDRELDFCLAASLNCKKVGSEWPRTRLGEAEFQMKYKEDPLYFGILISALEKAFGYLPIGGRRVTICVIPSEDNPKKLPRQLARELSSQVGSSFIDVTLNCTKPQMKNCKFPEKITTWERILSSEENITLAAGIKDKHIVIIDDLYQSGVTMWSFAKYLKSQGAQSVFGLVCVKALSDDDNTQVDINQ